MYKYVKNGAAEVVEALVRGELIMLPQHFYAEAFKMKEDGSGKSLIVDVSSGEKVEDLEVLGLLLSDDSLKWRVLPSEFEDATLEAWTEYFSNDEAIEYTGPLLTECICNKCGNKVLRENKSNYPYFCISCDENKFQFEVIEIKTT